MQRQRRRNGRRGLRPELAAVAHAVHRRSVRRLLGVHEAAVLRDDSACTRHRQCSARADRTRARRHPRLPVERDELGAAVEQRARALRSGVVIGSVVLADDQDGNDRRDGSRRAASSWTNRDPHLALSERNARAPAALRQLPPFTGAQGTNFKALNHFLELGSGTIRDTYTNPSVDNKSDKLRGYLGTIGRPGAITKSWRILPSLRVAIRPKSPAFQPAIRRTRRW